VLQLLKDDPALDAYLANSAVEGAALIPADGEPPITGEALEKLLVGYAAAREAIARNAHRYDPTLLEALIDFVPLDPAHLARDTHQREELDALEAKLNQGSLGSANCNQLPSIACRLCWPRAGTWAKSSSRSCPCPRSRAAS
jgi:DNA gyrase subunit B